MKLAIPMAVVVLANIMYHVCTRSIVTTVHPLSSLMATYIVAILMTLVLYPFFGGQFAELSSELRQLNWASYALALGIVGLEVGFILAYRTGWRINIAALYSTVLVSLLLIPIGLGFFREKLSLLNCVGIVFAITGVVLMSMKSTPD